MVAPLHQALEEVVGRLAVQIEGRLDIRQQTPGNRLLPLLGQADVGKERLVFALQLEVTTDGAQRLMGVQKQ